MDTFKQSVFKRIFAVTSPQEFPLSGALWLSNSLQTMQLCPKASTEKHLSRTRGLQHTLKREGAAFPFHMRFFATDRPHITNLRTQQRPRSPGRTQRRGSATGEREESECGPPRPRGREPTDAGRGLTLGERVQHPRLLQVPAELLPLGVLGLREDAHTVSATALPPAPQLTEAARWARPAPPSPPRRARPLPSRDRSLPPRWQRDWATPSPRARSAPTL